MPKLPDIPIHLQGERIAFVPLDAALHLENYLRWFNDPDVTRMISRHLPMMRLAEERFFERMATSTTDIVWAVHDEAGRHIGATGVHALDWPNRSAVTGTVIGDKSAWGKGYGAEIMRLRTRWIFQELGLHRIESECFAENLGSAACLAKAGYRQMGLARSKFWRGGRWHDVILWEQLAEDYFARSGPDGGSPAHVPAVPDPSTPSAPSSPPSGSDPS